MSGPIRLARRKRGYGRKVIFLHPVGLRGSFWDGVGLRLADTVECIEVDLRGHGGSPWDGQSFSLDDLARDVVALMEEEGGQALVVGCSIGGMVAQGIALAAPHLVSALLVSNSAASLPPPARDGLKLRAQMACDEPKRHADDCIQRWFSRRFAEEAPERVQAVHDMLLATDPQAIALSWLAVSELDYAARLPAFKRRVHIVTGEFDTSSPPGALAAHAALFENSSMQVILGAGHLAPYEAADTFSQIVLRLAAEANDTSNARS